MCMKKKFAFIFLYFFAFAFPYRLVAQTNTVTNDSSVNINLNLNQLVSDDGEERRQADSVLQALADAETLVKFTNTWKIKTGDDSSWAAPDFDDTDWSSLDDSIRDNRDYAGITWYRMLFEIDSSLYNVPLALMLRQFGSAAEVYLDGKFLKSFGKVGKDKASEVAEFSVMPKPFAFVFTPQKKHVFAIRYSNFHRAESKGSGFNIGKNFTLSINSLNEEIADVSDPSNFFPFIFFAAIFITLAVVHLIMFLYYRQKITNLYYSLYCIGIFSITIYIYYILTSTDYATITVLSKTAGFAAPLLIVPIVAMLHNIFYERLLKIFWVLLALFMAGLACMSLDFDKAATIIIVILFLIAIVEIIRVIFKAIRKKKDGAWIFAMALLLCPIMAIVSSYLPEEMHVFGLKIPINGGAIVLTSFVLGMPLSMTIYLARDFARMSKKLNLQLKEITTLSEKTIRQEKEKKEILENQKSELELKVVERTQEVWEQKEVIEIKNREITESLIYAKRIQSAILPDIKLIYKTLEQSFILYLPKDIVSGDFYGFAQKSGRVIIAAADCTGHGVAGAFMSMIGTSLLNQIINEKNVVEPGLILEQLNEGIIHSLKQKESESNDGMDISLCSFDLKNNELVYAGANRPLWHIRNNDLLVYKPNKFPIGGLQVEHNEKFSRHVITLQKNDTFYLFSDGFADQFGGERSKKLMTKKFKEMLLSIRHLGMREQEHFLQSHFEKWKGNNEQVDDVLVIGIRV